MAKILYGVMGNTHGHIMRSLAIARQMPEHQFHFVGGYRVPAAVREHYPVLEVPVPRTIHRNQRVDVAATFAQVTRRTLEIPRVVRQIARLIESWQPDFALCDREFFLPLACLRTGLSCLSVNHSRILLACRYPVPPAQFVSWTLAMLNDRLLFNFTRRHLVVSFFHPQLKRTDRDELMPPVLRAEAAAIRPTRGNHVLVYQTSPTFAALIETVRKLNRPVIVYGFKNTRETSGNITFKPFHPQGVLEDLASSAYAVTNGSHNILSEAFFYGKPVLCFPIATLFEQFLNSWHVRELDYGDFSVSRRPDPGLFLAFEKNLERHRAALARGSFNGTCRVAARINEILRQASGGKT